VSPLPASRPTLQTDPGLPGGSDWLERETARLLEFAAGSKVETGFGWLNETGGVERDRPVELYITGRMTHTFALAVLEGRTGYAELLQHGLDGLERMRDREHGGWHARVQANGDPVPGGGKGSYELTFVALAGASAVAAGHEGGKTLMDDALAVLAEKFQDESGMIADQYDDAFTALDSYRGINANMHAVECYLAAADAYRLLGDARKQNACTTAADRITQRVLGYAAQNGRRIPEHFDEQWNPQLEYNRDKPRDQFRPYGATIGHSFEWARLALHLAEATGRPELRKAARGLFDQGVTDGWNVDGATGIVYTVDWNGAPVVHERMSWVIAEGVLTADALARATGQTEPYAGWYRTWWAWIDEHLVDREHGSWWNELSRENRPSSTVWEGKPDAYHAVQSTMLPRHAFGVSVAGGLTQN
jgi:sulfoquinovose isomerase